MSRETEERREAIDQTARDFRDTVHRAGDTSYTFEQARERVVDAVTRGDRKRENGNR